jgi:hypothetical protein
MKAYKQAAYTKNAVKEVSLDLRPVQGWLNTLAEVARHYNQVVTSVVELRVHPDGRAELHRRETPKPVWREVEEVVSDG